MGPRHLGASVQRVEDPRLLIGGGRFLDDINPPHQLHAGFVRSPHAHARVRGVDGAAASALPGVHGVFTLADFGPAFAGKRMPLTVPHPRLRQPVTQYPLAVDEVCYVGEPVAVVVADSRYLAEDAVALVEVEYEPLPAQADLLSASAPDAPSVHLGAVGNLAATLEARCGDAQATFAGAAHIFSERLVMHRGGCHAMEGRGVLAAATPGKDELTVWTSTQSPYIVRRHLATYLGIGEDRLRVVAPDVGGGFGPKAVFYPEEIVVPLLARKLGRPVKWIEDRREHFVATAQQRDQVWDIEVAADADGRILGLRGRGVHDSGAYVPYGIALPMTSLWPFPGPYAIAALDLVLDVVFTNLTPTAPVRGAGRPYGAFVIERAVDRVAHELGIDRAEIRRRNFVRKDQFPYATGLLNRDGSPVRYDSGDFHACLEAALDLADYGGFEMRRAEAHARGLHAGIGVASYVEDTGAGPYEGASVRVLPTGKVLVRTGAASQGQGHATIFAQICADELGVGLEDINVESADTGAFPMGMGTYASRIAVAGGSSVQKAARAVRDKALAFAAGQLQAKPQDLMIADGVIRAGAPGAAELSLAEIARALAGVPGLPLPDGLSPGLEAEAYELIAEPTYANGAHVAEVEVDPGTGDVRVVRYSVGHDCGTLLNPRLVDGQILGGVVHGLGNALFERMVHDADGQPLTTNYGEYLLPLASETPPIAIAHIETPSPRNPLGAKGAGEAGTIPAAAAIISAIEDALKPFGARIGRHPLGPQDVVRLIDEGSQAHAHRE